MVRTETVCASAARTWATSSPTAPTDTGLRYCMNSASLDFQPEEPAK